MDRLEFEDYEKFACEISDTFSSLEDEFGDISIIAKYDDAKEIIRELLCLGYDIASLDIHDELWENYYDEYIISVSYDEESFSVWCEKFKRESGYLNDSSSVTYVMDNCSSAIFKHIDSKEIYEVYVGEDDLCEDTNSDEFDEANDEYEVEHSYMVNGKSVDKKTFNEYVSKFAPDLVDDDDSEDEDDTDNDSGYSVTVKVGLDTDEAEKMIRDMEDNFRKRMSGMFDMLYRPYLYEYRPQPLRFFW